MADELTTTNDHAAYSKQMIWVLVGSVLLTVALFYVPYLKLLGRPLLLFSTFAHEMGHGIAAELVGGTFHHFVMSADGSGLASSSLPVAPGSSSPSAFRSSFVSFGGLVGPATLAAILFGLTSRPKLARPVMIGLGIACFLAVALVVRNVFGGVFVGLFGLAFVAIGGAASPRVAHFALVFVAVQLALSVFSRGDYLFTETAQTAQGAFPSDVGQIQEALLLPYWFWGALIAIISVGILAIGGRAYWRGIVRLQALAETQSSTGTAATRPNA